MPKKIIELDFCPRCKSDLWNMMTRVVYGVKWCYLCSFDLEESPKHERDHWINWAKERAEMEGK